MFVLLYFGMFVIVTKMKKMKNNNIFHFLLLGNDKKT